MLNLEKVKKQHLRAKSKKIKNKKDFSRLFCKRNRKIFSGIILFMVSNDLSYSRFLVSVQKKVGNAVCRNTVKRRAREILMTIPDDLTTGYDFAFIFKRNFLYSKMQENIYKIFKI